VPLLKPGQEDVISITFRIPNDIKNETTYFSEWRFCYKGKIFGKPLNLNTVVRPCPTTERPTGHDNIEGHFRLLESDNELSGSDDDSVVYPSCFNLDVPFLLANDLDQTAKKSETQQKTTDTTSISTSNSASIKNLATETSGSRSSNSKQKMMCAKKLESLEQHKKACLAKKKQFKSSKAGSSKGANESPVIPIPSTSITEKIKAKNASNRNKANSNVTQPDNGTTACTKTGKALTPECIRPSSSTRTSNRYFSDLLAGKISLLESDHLPFMSNVSAIGETVSNICNMIANPGPSVNVSTPA